MSLSNNLLYLLLLYAVLDNDNRLSTTTGILLALGIMLFGCCNRAINACCGNGCACVFSLPAPPLGFPCKLARGRKLLFKIALSGHIITQGYGKVYEF